jgi:hypothetical protein
MHVQPEYENDAGAHPDEPVADFTRTAAHWMQIGSLKPEHSSDPDWARSKAMANCLKELIQGAAQGIYNGRIKNNGEPYSTERNVGLIISFEYPTPMNTHLTSLNRILHLILLDAELKSYFSTIRILMTNASTLRSLMGLTKTGAKNKVENIAKAYTFVNKVKFPELDSDSCDGVLLAMMARYASSILSGFPQEVPEKFLNKLCDGSQAMKGAGRNSHIITQGLLHRQEYWYMYEPKEYQILVKDASIQTKRLKRAPFNI